MIACPQCGFAAADGAKFCDRCGQGLASRSAPPPLIPPLAPGTILKGGFEIVELLNATSIENRYSAARLADGKKELFQLRERIGPLPDETATVGEETSSPLLPAPQEDPNGPRAKTRELKPLAADASSEAPARSSLTADGTPADSPTDEAATDSLALSESAAAAPVEALASSETAEADRVDHAHAEPPADIDSGAGADSSEPPTDIGEVFGRVLALSVSVTHPAFHRALSGFADNGRVYLVYPDETFTPLSRRAGGIRMREPEAIGLAIQVCQAVSALHRRGLRVNDICPDSVVYAAGGRVKLTGFDYVSNDTEIQAEPIFNDGYTAPEIYKGKGRKVDKRADVFSVGALLYTCLAGERIEAESWREEAGTVSFYPPHVVSPRLEQAVRRALAFSPDERWPSIDAFKTELINLNGAIGIRAAALTDVGRVRELNEDSVMAIEYGRQSQIEPARQYLYVVADGMGGAAAGEVASAIAVATMRDYVEKELSAAGAKDLCQLLKDGLEQANSRILDHQAANPDLRGMGSTAVSALIIPPEAALGWVGDSRAYSVEGSTIRQLTKDHSLVQRLIEIGQISPEQARHHEHKNVITRSLGARQSGPAGAEAVAVRLKRGDRMVLCSDGLTAHVEDEQIGEIVGRHDDPYPAARELVVAANAGGGTDNISVVVIFAE